MKVRPNIKLTTDETMVALAAMYSGQQWAFLTQVRSATGYSRLRTADAIAMSVWPSRGLHLYGFEVKTHRGDWLNELRKPAKAEEICGFCDFWYVVIGERWIAKPEELPPTWGLIGPVAKNKLGVYREAPQLKANRIDNLLLASILRNVNRSTVPYSSIKAELAAERERGREEMRSHVEIAEGNARTAEKAIADFETASGIKLNQWDAKPVGESLGLLLNSNLPRFKSVLEMFHESCADVAGKLDRVVTEVEAIRLQARKGK